MYILCVVHCCIPILNPPWCVIDAQVSDCWMSVFLVRAHLEWAMLFKSIYTFSWPRVMLAYRHISWGQGFCFCGTWLTWLSGEEMHRQLALHGFPAWEVIALHWSLVRHLLFQAASFTGGETEALRWCQHYKPSLPTSGLYEFPYRFAYKQQREKRRRAFGQFIKELRKISPA